MNLNINEQLFRDTKDAHVCIFMANLQSWIRYNATKADPDQRNYREGRYWSYNTLPDLAKFFDFWSIKNIRTIIKHCQEHGLLMTGNFNAKKYDKTIWYTLTDKALEYFPYLKEIFQNPLPETAEGNARNGRPIPYTTTHKENINNSEFNNSPAAATKKPKPQKQSSREALAFLMALINVYREVFPDNPQPHKRVISTSLQRTLSTLVKRWPELDPDGLPLTVEVFKQYLTELKANCPKFALGEYVTEQGNRKKNNLETFSRWNTVIKFLENAYS